MTTWIPKEPCWFKMMVDSKESVILMEEKWDEKYDYSRVKNAKIAPM